MNCHGCKWLDEYKENGRGYCSMVVRSKNYETMPCAMDLGRRAPKIRRSHDERCELYEAGDFRKRFG